MDFSAMIYIADAKADEFSHAKPRTDTKGEEPLISIFISVGKLVEDFGHLMFFERSARCSHNYRSLLSIFLSSGNSASSGFFVQRSKSSGISVRSGDRMLTEFC